MHLKRLPQLRRRATIRCSDILLNFVVSPVSRERGRGVQSFCRDVARAGGTLPGPEVSHSDDLLVHLRVCIVLYRRFLSVVNI